MEPIAISVLMPSGSAISTAERFGFKTKDLEGTSFEKWRKVAVQARSEMWSRPARDLVAKCSHAVIALNSGETPTPDGIAEFLDDLLVA